MPEYTQEQLDQMIADAKVGLFTREEHERELQREVDRRVETGIQKGLETHSERIRREAEEKAKLTAEERARLEVAEKEKQIAQREKEISRKANELEAKDLLVSAGVPKEQYAKLLSVFVSENLDTTKTNVQNFIDVFNATKKETETAIRSELTKVTPPQSGGSSTMTQADFNKLTYAQKLEFKQKSPEVYKQFVK